jgi:hypothetical protein
MTAHKANPEHWQLLEEYAGIDCYSDACLLELRARIEALEAANPGCPHIATSTEGTSYCRLAEQAATSQTTPNPGPLRTSLVERVAIAISRCEDSSCWDDEAVNWEPEARAAIREVLTWLKEGEHTWAALKLQQEAER